MISWRSTVGGYSASLMVGGVVFAHLHARADAWQIEHHSGHIAGPAGSIGEAKRTALERLAELLRKAAHEVEVALRST